ncbi:MAG: heavy metal translocating P-type ATPase [Pseudomonadota bacterium]
MLLDVGILLGMYIGARLFENKGKQLKNKNIAKGLVKKNLTLQPITKSQPLLKDTISNNHDKKHDFYLKISSTSIGLATIGYFLPALHFLSIGMISYTSLPILKHAETSLIKKGKIGHTMLMSVLFVLALITNQSFALTVSIFFYYFGEKSLAKTYNNSKKMLTHLFDKQPDKVWVLKNDIEIEVPLEVININDIVIINTGEIVPIDGIITDGMARIDQHTLTGEYQPAEKGIGEKVFASTNILSGRICVKVEKTGVDTTIYRIGNMLNSTADFKTKLQSKGEKWANQVAKPLLGISAFGLPIIGAVSSTAILNSSFGNRVRLLVPLAVLNHLNIAVNQGILIKDGRVLEELNRVDTILFDKTGTLTEEQPKVGEIILCDNDYNEDDILTYAAAAEGKLQHPIAKAILEKAKESHLTLPEIEDSQYQIGLGITVFLANKIIKVGSLRFMKTNDIVIPEIIETAMEHSHNQGHSLIMVAINNEIKGALEIQPTMRLEVKQMISDLRQRGIKHIAIVSGDHKHPTEKLAKYLGMDSYYYDVLPENKAQIVEQLQKNGNVVCFIGDGVNDAIAIKKANVSISLKGASSVATDLAQVILMDGNLSNFVKFFDIGKSLEKNLQNTFMILSGPAILIMGGALFLHFNLITTVMINNISFLFGLVNLQRQAANSKKES